MKAVAEKQAGRGISLTLSAQAGGKQPVALVTGLSQIFDKVAGLCLMAVMLLVVANVILRTAFNRPILGTVEYVGFITASAIGLSLAFCAIKNAHIAVDFIAQKFPARLQAAVDMVINSIAVGFWGLAAWNMFVYARSLAASGVVSSTTQTPYHHFVYLVALGLFTLSLAMAVRVIYTVKRVAVDK